MTFALGLGWLEMDADLPCPERSEGTQQLQTASHWRPRFEATWAEEIEPVRERWRARAASSGLAEGQRVYALARAISLSRPYYEREDACSTTGTEVRCGCWVGSTPPDPDGVTPDDYKGRRGRRKRGIVDEMVRWHACRRHLTCARCRAERSVKYGARIRDALETNIATLYQHPVVRGGWRKPLVVMMTVGVRHSGDVDEDRRELALCWRRFRDAYAHRFGRFPFVGVYEVTPGRDGLGHVHAHVLCLWPRGRSGDGTGGDWKLLQRMWVDAARGRSVRCNFEASERCGDAAGYVSKYVAKGVASAEFSPELAAKVASATYNTRWVFTSRGFWLPWEGICPCCNQKVESVTFRFPRAEGSAAPATDWSTGPPSERRYQQAIFPFPEPDERGSAGSTGRRIAMGNRRRRDSQRR